MLILNEQQKQRAIEVMQEYLAATPEPMANTSTEVRRRDFPLDEKRVEVIEEKLKPLLKSYLDGETALGKFKSGIDSLNKRNSYWGFKGIKGQMFFNLIVKVAEDLEECDEELKSAITIPENEKIASSRLKTFASYIKRLGQEWVDAGNDSRGCPKVSSIPFFLSYFWQIQDCRTWPVYYTNGVETMKDLNLWEEPDDFGDAYVKFKHIHEELKELFTKESGKPFNLYTVEHVFWFKGENPLTNTGGKAIEPIKIKGVKIDEVTITDEDITLLPVSYVPPIISILPRMAKNDESLKEAAKRSGITLERAFEKHVNAAFTILGYETKLLGQGQGRVPDGLAIAHDENYVIIWDAKIRSNGYSLGTDDRTIREYIHTQSREMKRRRSMRNIYYMIVSSEFSDDFDDSIRSIKMETDVNEVCLLEADALLAMVDAKLRSPLQTSLGSDGFQQLFANSGILSGKMVRELLM
jgi:hypothetical protein